MSRFALLMADLGALINVPLHVDAMGGCSLNINQKLQINLQEEENKDALLVATFIAVLYPGPFREKIFKETLQENNLPDRLGIFGYCGRNHQLALFSHLSFSGLQGNILADFLEIFIEVALSWKSAVETGQIPRKNGDLYKKKPYTFEVKET